MEKVRLPILADDQRTFPTEDSFWQGKPLLIPAPDYLATAWLV